MTSKLHKHIAVVLVAFSMQPLCAQSALNKRGRRARREVASIAIGSPISISTVDRQQHEGLLFVRDADTFTYRDSINHLDMAVAYDDVSSVRDTGVQATIARQKRNHQITRAAILVGLTVMLAVLVIEGGRS